MRCFAFLVLTFLSASTCVRADDTMAAFMRDTTHVGVAINEQLSSFDVYLYTQAHYVTNVANLKKHRLDSEEYRRQLKSLDEELREAQSRRAPSAERNAITQKRSQIHRPYSPFEGKIKLYKVDHAGADYFRLSRLGSTRQFVVIPFSKIARVFVPNASMVDSKSADKGESKR